MPTAAHTKEMLDEALADLRKSWKRTKHHLIDQKTLDKIISLGFLYLL